MDICLNCKHYKPHKNLKFPFVGGNWVGDGRYEEGVNGEYTFTTVEGNSCEHWEAK